MTCATARTPAIRDNSLKELIQFGLVYFWDDQKHEQPELNQFLQ